MGNTPATRGWEPCGPWLLTSPGPAPSLLGAPPGGDRGPTTLPYQPTVRWHSRQCWPGLCSLQLLQLGHELLTEPELGCHLCLNVVIATGASIVLHSPRAATPRTHLPKLPLIVRGGTVGSPAPGTLGVQLAQLCHLAIDGRVQLVVQGALDSPQPLLTLLLMMFDVRG